ncbi:MAG: AAA family ATPase [Bacteroidales bacterium]
MPERTNMGGIDLRKVFRKYLRNWYFFVLATGLAIVLAYIYNRYQIPVYQLNTRLLIKEEAKNILLSNGSASIMNSVTIDNEISMIRSSSAIRETLSHLNMGITYLSKGDVISLEIYKSSPFRVVADTLHAQPYNKHIGIRFLSENTFVLDDEEDIFDKSTVYQTGSFIEGEKFRFKIEMKSFAEAGSYAGTSYGFIIHSWNALIAQYRNKINIELKDRGAILEISSHGNNVQKEKDFLNKHTEVIIRKNLEKKNKIANNTIAFIDNQMEQIRTQLTGAETRLEYFRKNNALMTLSDKSEPLMQRINSLERTKADILMDLEYYRYLKDYLEKNKDVRNIIAPATVGISLPLFSDLLEKLSVQYLEREKLIVNATEENPSIQTLNNSIEQQKKILLENINNVIRITQMKASDYERKINEKLNELSKLPGLEREYLDIQRVYRLNDDMYNYLLEKRAEAEIVRASTIPDLMLLDRAGENGVRKVYPDTKTNYLKAVILAILLPSVLLFFSVYLGKRINEFSDLQALTGLPVLGLVPHHPVKCPKKCFDRANSGFSQSMRLIRTHIPLKNKNGGHAIALTSSITGEGKTYLSLNLAYACALTGKKTLLAGLDFQRPGIAKKFNIPDDPGVAGYVSDEMDLYSVIHHSDIPELDILPEGRSPENVDAILQSEKFRKMMADLKARYEYIIMDTSPAGLFADPYIINQYSDATLVVVRQKKTPVKILAAMLDKAANENKLNNLCLIYNDSRSMQTLSPFEYYNGNARKKGFSGIISRLKGNVS